jgi:hypothetical protein
VDVDPRELQPADLLAGLRNGRIDSTHVRSSAATLLARAGYSTRSMYAHLGRTPRKRRIRVEDRR